MQCSNYTHNQPRGRRREVLRTEVAGEGEKGAEVVSVNMHRLGESFVEKVSDVRRRATVDGKAAVPGESLEFLAHIRGWQSEARKQRRDQLLHLNDTGLRVSLTRAAGADIFFIPEVHLARETPELDDEGWRYQVRSVIWCRECRYGRSSGAESVENVEFARSKRSSNKMKGTKSSLPYAFGVSLERTRKGLPQVGKEKRANGSKTPPIPRRGDPEQPMG